MGGTVERMTHLKDKGMAFVQYADSEGFEKCLAWHDTWYKGRQLTVKKATDDSGKRPRRDRDDRGDRGDWDKDKKWEKDRGWDKKSDWDKGYDKKDGRDKWSSRRWEEKRDRDEFTIIIKNVAEDVTEWDLWDDFKSCGDIERCKLPKGDDGKIKGSAFIQYKDN